MRALILIILMFFVIGYLHNASNTINAQQHTIDSLQTELFIKSTDLGKYEIAVELLGQQDTIAANKLLYIYNNQTE